MADSKLVGFPALSLGTKPDVYYAADQSGVSKKFKSDRRFNVRDNYGGAGGAKGDGVTDDRAAIQAAIDAAQAASPPGGIIYFPPGNYLIGSRLTVAASYYSALTFEGCGGTQLGGAKASCITGQFADWLLYIPGPGFNQAVKVIKQLGFLNSYVATAAITSSAPGTTGCVSVEGGITQVNIYDCEFYCHRGICVYNGTQNHTVIGCSLYGFYPTYDESVGYVGIGSVKNCKIQGCGIGISVFGNPQNGVYEGIDIEVCKTGVSIGSPPISWYNLASGLYIPAGWQPENVAKNAIFQNIGMESCHSVFFYIGRADIITINECILSSFEVAALAGIQIDDFCSNSVISNILIAGNFSATGGAGVLFGPSGSGSFANTVFDNVASGPTSGPAWSAYQTFPSAWGSNLDAPRIRNCAFFDGAVTIAHLPPSPTTIGQKMVVSNSADPMWTGTASNVGKPFSGTGSNKVIAMWNGSAWVIGC